MLSTVHSAKGQEWDSVYVLNVTDGSFPSEFATGRAESIEEERRLLYVAMTRAKRDLHLLAPVRFYITQQSPRGRPVRARRPQPFHERSGARAGSRRRSWPRRAVTADSGSQAARRRRADCATCR